MNRTYTRVNWQNLPSRATPISAQNLNKGDYALDVIDQRVITLDTVKANKTDLNSLVKDVTYNESNGVFTITKFDNTKFNIDTDLEKIVVNFTYDEDTEELVVTDGDGNEKRISLSAFISENEFDDSERITFSVENHHVTADLKKGSITGEYLDPDYLDDITQQVDRAEEAVESIGTSADDAAYNAKLSQSYAIGLSGIREGEDTDNAKYYCEQAYLSDYSIMSRSYAIGGTGRREGEDTDNSKFYSELAREQTITEITATVDDNIGTPEVDVTQTSSSTDSHKTFRFDFRNLKGERGPQGEEGSSAVDAYINDFHHLIIVYDDAHEVDAGDVGANVISLTTEEYRVLPREIRDDEGLYFWITDCDGNTASIIVAGTSNYNSLYNKPQINGVTLEGNKTPEELGLVSTLKINDFTLNNHTYSIPDLKIPGKILEEGSTLYLDEDEQSPVIVEEGAEIFNDYRDITYDGWGRQETGNISAGKYSHSEGRTSKALGEQSHAEGASTALGNCSHSEGLTDYSTSEQKILDSTGKVSNLFYFEKGAMGFASHSEGNGCNAQADAAHAEGFSTWATGKGSHAEGNSLACGYYSHAEGQSYQDIHGGITADNLAGALGNYSHVEGRFTLAEGYEAHAEGKSTKAIADESHAEGLFTSAEGTASHAEGNRSKASGSSSHAECYGTVASGTNSHAEGGFTIASGNGSHAEGINTTAGGNYSHAGGNNTIAGYESQTAIGKYNNNKSDSIVEVGNGSSSRRSNIFEVFNNRINVEGDYYQYGKKIEFGGGGGGTKAIFIQSARKLFIGQVYGGTTRYIRLDISEIWPSSVPYSEYHVINAQIGMDSLPSTPETTMKDVVFSYFIGGWYNMLYLWITNKGQNSVSLDMIVMITAVEKNSVVFSQLPNI